MPAALRDRDALSSALRALREKHVLSPTDQPDSGALEECVDELDGVIAALDRFPEGVIALALRVHLGALLRTLVEQQACSREDVRRFVVELEQEALGVGED